jgi:hypothetical protein
MIGINEEMMKGIFFIEECKKRSQIITRDITSQTCKRCLSSICGIYYSPNNNHHNSRGGVVVEGEYLKYEHTANEEINRRAVGERDSGANREGKDRSTART